MRIPDDKLMAYADGELDTAERAEIEAAIAADPSLARRVETHRALRSKMSRAFGSVLDEPIPEQLLHAVRGERAATREDRVADLSHVRAEKTARAERARGGWSWPQWGAIAASVVLGIVIGQSFVRSPRPWLGQIGSDAGRLVAQAGLDDALTNQLASEQPRSAPVQIGVSFRGKGGEVCRAFTIREPDALSGLACRETGSWSVRVLARAEDQGTPENYRQAGSELPAAVRAVVEAQIADEPFDSAAEAAARRSGWK